MSVSYEVAFGAVRSAVVAAVVEAWGPGSGPGAVDRVRVNEPVVEPEVPCAWVRTERVTLDAETPLTDEARLRFEIGGAWDKTEIEDGDGFRMARAAALRAALLELGEGYLPMVTEVRLEAASGRWLGIGVRFEVRVSVMR